MCSSQRPPGATVRSGDLSPDRYSATDISEQQVNDAIDKVDAIGQAVMARTGIPGLAIAVVHRGKVQYAKGFGIREVGKLETVDADTVFQIASVSKSVSSTCVAKAVTNNTVGVVGPSGEVPSGLQALGPDGDPAADGRRPVRTPQRSAERCWRRPGGARVLPRADPVETVAVPAQPVPG